MSERKVALVTGGSRGIGRAVCLRLAKDGMDIVLNYAGNDAAAEETAGLVRAQGVLCEIIKADVSKPESASHIVKFCKEKFGRLDVLVNNAGITRDNLIMGIKEEDFDAVVDTNLKGAFFLSKEASRMMLKQRSGSMIFVSSVVGLHGNAGQTNYAAAKAGLIGLSKSLAKELAGRGIRANVVAPGFIGTDMTDVLSDEIKENLKTAIPLGSIGSPEDVANAVSFLASDESAYITGVTISVDGGMGM